METRSSFSHEFTVGQLFSMARVLACRVQRCLSDGVSRALTRAGWPWSIHFSLVVNIALRAPTFVRIMGDHDDIADRLLELRKMSQLARKLKPTVSTGRLMEKPALQCFHL